VLLELHLGSLFSSPLWQVHWHVALFGDCSSLVRSSFSRFGSAWESRPYFPFGRSGVVLSLSMRLAPCQLFVSCGLEVCHQRLAKGALLIKDAQSLDSTAYSDFISALVALRKRL
jgi:hypothetical protein